MDYRFLGPLEARSAGVPLPLGGQRQRGILAVLLLSPNTVVTVDRLVDDVWGAAPPRTVQAYVQNCVSRLRTVLGRDAIETHPGGYLLRVDPEDVDALRFAHAVEAARGLDLPERVATLNEALALWRGPPLTDFTYEPFAQAEIARLEELRLEALEARLESQVDLGGHVGALPEIEALAARHPSRERLRYLQMLALYRSDRQHDALAVYQEARRELIEQFGLEPSDQLRALERMILAQDPSLRPSTPADRLPRARSACVVLVAEPGGEAVEAVVRSSGGSVRSNDDGRLVGVYGAERLRDDDALRAVRAALVIQGNVESACVAVNRVADVDRDPIDGELLSGASPGETIIGASVLPLVAHAVDVVAQPGGGFRVLHVDDTADALPRRFDTPMVGRRGDLAQLYEELEQATTGHAPRRLVVVGDAGIGKTRLVREFAVQASARFLWSRCAPHDARDVVGDLIDQLEPVDALLADEPDAERVAAAVRARSRSGWTEEQWTLRRMLEAAASRGPVVVVLDDLHWAPANILDLIDYLGGWTRGAVLILGLTRPELLESRTDVGSYALQLGPLSTAESLELASALPGREAVEPVLLSRLAENAEGNPLYIEQLVAWSSEEHVEHVPPTIELLIAMRIEGLPASERRVLERASVVGTEFWRGAVEAAAPEDERTAAGPALMALVRRGLVQPAPAFRQGEDGFRFHHALIRDVVYGAIPPEERAQVHAAIARSIDAAPEYDAIAGRHLEEATLVDVALAPEAARRLGAAGMRALWRIDALPAIDLLERAARLTPEGERRRELDWGIATARKFAGDPVHAEELLEDVAVRADAAGDTTNELRARIEEVWPRLTRGALRVEQALRLLERAIPVLAAAQDEFALARAWDIAAAVRGVYLLQAAACETAGLEARAHYERAGSTTGAADVRLAGVGWTGPMPVPAAIERCRRILAGSETPVWASFVQPFLAALLTLEGRFDEARAVLEEARTGRAEFADPRTLDTSWAFFAADVEVHAGELDEAERILHDVMPRLEASGNAEWAATNGTLLADVHARRGRYAQALETSERALALVPAEHLTVVAVAQRVRADALDHLGRSGEALATAEGLAAALEATDALVARGRALLTLADVLDHAGRTAEAETRRAEAIGFFERKGDLVTLRSLGRG